MTREGGRREAGRERMDKKAKITPGKKSGRTESERRWKEEGEQKARKERERENENGGSTVFCSLTLKMYFLLHGQFPRKIKGADLCIVHTLRRVNEHIIMTSVPGLGFNAVV